METPFPPPPPLVNAETRSDNDTPIQMKPIPLPADTCSDNDTPIQMKPTPLPLPLQSDGGSWESLLNLLLPLQSPRKDQLLAAAMA